MRVRMLAERCHRASLAKASGLRTLTAGTEGRKVLLQLTICLLAQQGVPHELRFGGADACANSALRYAAGILGEYTAVRLHFHGELISRARASYTTDLTPEARRNSAPGYS